MYIGMHMLLLQKISLCGLLLWLVDGDVSPAQTQSFSDCASDYTMYYPQYISIILLYKQEAYFFLIRLILYKQIYSQLLRQLAFLMVISLCFKPTRTVMDKCQVGHNIGSFRKKIMTGAATAIANPSVFIDKMRNSRRYHTRFPHGFANDSINIMEFTFIAHCGW